MPVELTDQPIPIEAALRGLACPEAGAVVTFIGTVRDTARDRQVLRLEYSAYREMALRLMSELAGEARRRFDLRELALIHRLGILEVGEASVFIGAAAPHRDAAFAACRFLIDEIKKRVPIWKKEYYADGTAWIEGDSAREPV